MRVWQRWQHVAACNIWELNSLLFQVAGRHGGGQPASLACVREKRNQSTWSDELIPTSHLHRPHCLEGPWGVWGAWPSWCSVAFSLGLLLQPLARPAPIARASPEGMEEGEAARDPLKLPSPNLIAPSPAPGTFFSEKSREPQKCAWSEENLCPVWPPAWCWVLIIYYKSCWKAMSWTGHQNLCVLQMVMPASHVSHW